MGRMVEIETEWNLEFVSPASPVSAHFVEIETEWNLEFRSICYLMGRLLVEIETEWNLECVARDLYLYEGWLR